VSKFVISSLRYLDDKTFDNLSVSSHKWIHIDEVLLLLIALRYTRFQPITLHEN